MRRDAEQAAVTAAEKWLALIDVGDFAGSWNQAASCSSPPYPRRDGEPLWKSAKPGSVKPCRVPRNPTGNTEELPGAPDGEYVVITYETAFERKRRATETVTPMKDEDVNGASPNTTSGNRGFPSRPG